MPDTPATRKTIVDRLTPEERSEQAIRLLQSWVDLGDEREQRETLDYLKHAVDADRPGSRKHFS